jgi:trk system potassium uptake protein TrkA
MRIVVVGAGKLGYCVARLLSKGQFDVVVVESDEARRNIVKNTLDVLTICGNGCSEEVLNMPEVKDADVCVACTSSDEVNMIISFLAKEHGIKYTIAQIKSEDYEAHADQLLHKEMRIDLALNPNRILANKIKSILESPSALAFDSFANGKINLYEINIEKNSEYLGKALKDITLPAGVLIAMITRGNDMIIPHGSEVIEKEDNIYFVGTSAAISSLKAKLDAGYKKMEHALVIGASQTVRILMPMLEQLNVFTKVIDNDKDRCQQLVELVNNGMVLCGDGTDFTFLKEEGISDADVVLCLTDNDKMNLLFALISRNLGAKKTIVRVARSEYVSLMEDAGIDITMSARLLFASEVLKFVRRNSLMGLLLLEGAQAEMMELQVGKDDPVEGKSLLKADFPKNCLICAVFRKEEAFIPDGNTVLTTGDRLVILAQNSVVPDVVKLFKNR